MPLPDALDALVVPVQLCVELMEVCDGGKYDTHPGVRLTVQFLKERNFNPSLSLSVRSL